MYTHISVMTDEAIKYLNLENGGLFVDVTLGAAGHSAAILASSQLTRVYGIDIDKSALERAKKQVGNNPRLHLVHGNFRHMEVLLAQKGIMQIDGLVGDLGLSSMELDDPERGFSFRKDAPLDMRFNQADNIQTAYDIVNTYSQKELSRIFKEYGDEIYPGRIARLIVESRSKKPIQSTKELAEIVLQAVPSRAKRHRLHPATRVFQALRIEVNDELGALREMLEQAIKMTVSGGRIVIISFHSGEDRIVKNAFRDAAHLGRVNIITKKPLYPTLKEVQNNPRARSARMRVVEIKAHI
jgi:16S rRNA (cytosine1402-N4)-methyltransferase